MKLKEKVFTDDGPGTIVNTQFRKNTNGGPGCREYVVRLDDGRVRRYNTQHVRKKS